ncbi:uncharacterized protein LOC132307274 [Cornus florida]|uniref:uncharacterized protein LOC132307274 n=1 Tax=Cornus florida TaxID=4283 RepID=UPI0028A0C4D7|nr:uncharacterized protein LOC132307274 [Cornus florida]
MSKKKASGGSTTMTLKDFHGGSIPSDLPLPSAPGVTVRPSSRGFDRQSPWGQPIGRLDNRLRPGSAGSVRNFDDKTPFFNHSAQIGRNFDEDERKPLDGVSAPRRTISDESTRSMQISSEPKPEYSSTGKLPSRHVSASVSELSGGTASSYAAKFAAAGHVTVNSESLGSSSSYSARFTEARHVGGNGGRNVAAGSSPNAWAVRKEAVDIMEPVPAVQSAPNAALKFANASALEKVSSGRWMSKQTIHHQTDIEVIRHPESESEYRSNGNNIFNKNTHNVMHPAGGMEYHDMALARDAERSLIVDDGIRGSSRELLAHERATSPLYPEAKERKPTMYAEGLPALSNGKSGGLEVKSPTPSEPSERPKLKLLPRSKPLEGLDQPIGFKQGCPQPTDSDHVEDANELHGNANLMKPVVAGSDSGNRAVERPKLNLKLQPQPNEQLEGNVEKERKTLFGGARPRELVLKERGIDDVAVNSRDLSQPPNRVAQDVPRSPNVPLHATPTRYNERADKNSHDHRIGKNTDRRDHQLDAERTDVQRRNWRSDNWSSKETEKDRQQQQQQQQPRERPPSPETWRKPVEQPKTASHDAAGLRNGKAASAVELAQAFSRSISDSKTADRFSGQRGLPGRGQLPFSRLTGPTPRPQINNY